MEIKVLLVDDHLIFIEGLKSMLEKHRDIKVVGEARDGLAAVNMAESLSPDLVIMDISMPILNGIEATRRILANNPDIKIIILSMHSDKRYVSELLKTGALGYLLKDNAFDELSRCIESVMNNTPFLSKTINDIVVGDYIKNVRNNGQVNQSPLSARETEVLKLIAEGNSTKEIASILNLSAKTVESHRKQIMEKLELYNLPDLTKYAIRESIITL
ncbi:MAG: response regulator transcription factor [Firmicutes bacterium]|nr:response regulator transcription factor [Bacillota bacterium]